MINRIRAPLESLRQLALGIIIQQRIPASERTLLVDAEQLPGVTPISDGKSVENEKSNPSAVEKVGDEAHQAFNPRYSQNSWKQIERWEDEGGRIE